MVPTFEWRDWVKPRTSSVSIAGHCVFRWIIPCATGSREWHFRFRLFLQTFLRTAVCWSHACCMTHHPLLSDLRHSDNIRRHDGHRSLLQLTNSQCRTGIFPQHTRSHVAFSCRLRRRQLWLLVTHSHLLNRSLRNARSISGNTRNTRYLFRFILASDRFLTLQSTEL
jgi:hypothetical protein